MFKKAIVKSIVCLILLLSFVLLISPKAKAQNWFAMPPYNLLWPLWSPAFSPINALTGLPTPLVTTLTSHTLLPAEPALAWDPAMAFPYLLYKNPAILGGNLLYYDTALGFNPFPPSYLLDPITRLPVPLTLPLGYDLFPFTDQLTFGPIITAANLEYNTLYPPLTFWTTPLANLLTPALIWP